MAAQKGHIRLSPAPAGVTSRPCQVVLNGGAPISVDMVDPDVTFDCNEGDTYSVTAKDVTPAGASPDSVPFAGTVPVGPVVPPAPTILGVDFTAA